MKKNKTMAYTLAAALLVGGTFVGTKALFTDKEDNVGGLLTISTGDLNVSVTTPAGSDWHMVGDSNETNHGTKENSSTLETGLANFDNLKYGDTITKTITVTNDGTLKADLELVENKQVTDLLPEGIEITASFSNNAAEETADNITDETDNITVDTFTLEPHESVNVTFAINVVAGGQHNSSNSINSSSQEKKVINLKDAYKLEAEQVASVK